MQQLGKVFVSQKATLLDNIDFVQYWGRITGHGQAAWSTKMLKFHSYAAAFVVCLLGDKCWTCT